MEKIKTFACPECGCPDFVNKNLVGDGFRMCRQCHQDWWIDIDYTKKPLNKVVEDGQAKPKRCKKCFQIHDKRDYCYRIVERPPAT